MSEYAPPPPKVRVTRAQLKQIQANYKIASKLAKNTEKIEEKERVDELSKLDNEIDSIFYS